MELRTNDHCSRAHYRASESDGFHNTEAAAVGQSGPSWVVPYRGDVTAATVSRVMTTGTLSFLSAHGNDAARQRLVEDLLVEKHQGIHRQILGRGSDISMHRYIGEEGFNLGFSGERAVRRSSAMETDEPYDPIRIQAPGVKGGSGVPRAPRPSV